MTRKMRQVLIQEIRNNKNANQEKLAKKQRGTSQDNTNDLHREVISQFLFAK